MRLKKLYLIIFFALFTCKYSYSQNINITVPDTICKDDTLKILNNTANANTHYWTFCQKTSLLSTPTSTLLQHFNNELNSSVMTKPVFDGTDYYLFITNYNSRSIVKAKYGSSYSNIPSITNFGDFSGRIPQRLEGIEIRKDGNKWFGFIVTVTNLFRLDFGTNLDNAPTLVNLGNIGNLSWPHELYIFKNNNNWYGFTANRNTSSVSRLNFGTSLQNTPTGDNISNIGITGGASGLELVKDKKNEFYLFVTDLLGNKISRVKLGSNIMNTTPTHTTITGGALTGVLRGISIIKSCDSYVGYVSTENNKLVKMNFTGGLSGFINFTSVGNLGGDIKKTNDISTLIKGNDSTYYLFVTNINNTIARLAFKSCINTNQNFDPSASISPQNIIYKDTGYHTINYTINLGDANQKDTCFSIYVDKCCTATTELKGNSFICQNDSTMLYVEYDSIPKEIIWLKDNLELPQHKNKDSIWVKTEGSFTVKTKFSKCEKQNSKLISFYSYTLNINSDTILCKNDSIATHIDYNTTPTEISWFLNSVEQTQFKNRDSIWITTPGKFTVTAKFNSCIVSRAVNVKYNYNHVSVTGKPTICVDDSSQIQLNYDSIPDEITWYLNAIEQPQYKNKDNFQTTLNGKYEAVVKYGGCTASRTFDITYYTQQLAITGDTIFCTSDSVLLSANNNFTSYLWSNDSTQKTTYAKQQGTYKLRVLTSDGCTLMDSVFITKIEKNTIGILQDTALCILDFPFTYTINDTCQSCTYMWGSNTVGKTITIIDSGKYTLTVKHNVCKDLYDTITVTKFDCTDCLIHFPNAFTPDGNALNDTFKIIYDCSRLEKWEMKIFDRWGELITVFTDPNEGWNGVYKGKKAPEGVYLYLVSYIGGGKKESKAGTFNLLYLK